MTLQSGTIDAQSSDLRGTVLTGLRDAAGILFGTMLFGALFGASATAAGLDFPQTFVMSLLVFAGTAQYATLALWSTDLPLLAIAISTAMVTSRLALMGLSLAPTVRAMPLWMRPGGMFLINDGIWALSMRKVPGRNMVAYYLGVSGPIYLLWVLGTALGVLLTGLIDPVTAKSLAFAGIVFLAILVGMVAKGAAVPTLPLVLASLVAVALDGRIEAGPALILSVIVGGVTACFVKPARAVADD